MAERPELVTHRSEARNSAAILFIHGYSGHPEVTWGRFPELLGREPRLSGWDIYSIGYKSSLMPDVLRGLWKAQPALDTLGDLLRTTTGLPPVQRYGALCIVAHSMGGLVTQHALLDRDFRARVQHVFLFGTPSGGLRKASLMAFWKRQFRDMAEGGGFIRTLRERWSQEIGDRPPFRFWPVAGDEDEFVPRASSVDLFPPPHLVVPGDHLSLVKPKDASHRAVQLVIDGLTEGAARTGPLESARLAVERGQFGRAVAELEPRAAELDQDALVLLALALDGVGRREDAVRVLQERGEQAGTDVLGTLAGRIKRRWVGERRQADAELSRELYQRGYGLASAASDHGQAFYHAINIAFLELLHRKDVNTARSWARQALEHCEAEQRRVESGRLPDRDALWRVATEAEAHLVIGDTDTALARYRRAVELDLKPWQALSMYWQARLVAQNLDDRAAIHGLDALFTGDEGQ